MPDDRCPVCGHTFEGCTCTGTDLITEHITALEAPRD